LLLEFPGVVDAIRSAVDVQRGMAERNAGVPAEPQIRYRIGINVGDIIIDDDDIFGDGVNIAAHIEALAEAGDAERVRAPEAPRAAAPHPQTGSEGAASNR
jgi:adenylate cyclase